MVFIQRAILLSTIEREKILIMEHYLRVIIFVGQLISTIAIIKLFAYAIVRYRTSKRGGIYTGFAVAVNVIVIVGLCLYCSVATVNRLIFIFYDDHIPLERLFWILQVLEDTTYIFCLCGLNISGIFSTRRAASIKAPKRNRRAKDFGFCYPSLWKRIPFMVFVPVIYGAITVIVYNWDENISSQINKVDYSKISLWRCSKTHSGFYISIIYYAITGICHAINLLSLIVLRWYLKRYTITNENAHQLLWKKIPRARKSSIKCSIVMAIMWLFELSSLLTFASLYHTKSKFISDLSVTFEALYSLQGLFIYLTVFFYRSKQNENPVIKHFSKLYARETEDNEGFNAAEN